ncbi:hypothetical protein C9374_011203 [Naegleria lovaniensis]|uniref:Protein phosphatase n=1 Tax=Naegleria lovaniensis TaxID=51637 RepID=A0AA88GEW5_NAELO|nr:uncharacterized protein C9374_011203 [Naegleria lovaniensis]KAG2374124.1 hypothetical protein C9374_011203 [Naegleria lovaniensis]
MRALGSSWVMRSSSWFFSNQQQQQQHHMGHTVRAMITIMNRTESANDCSRNYSTTSKNLSSSSSMQAQVSCHTEPSKPLITPKIRYLHKDYRKSTSVNEPYNIFDIEYNKLRMELLEKEEQSSSLQASSASSAVEAQQNNNTTHSTPYLNKMYLIAQGYCLGKAYRQQVQGDDEKLYGGEDAFFIQDNNDMTCHNNPYKVDPKNSVQCVGVADGVGGWSQYGRDSSLMSRQLMQNCYFYSLYNGKEYEDPAKLIERSYSDIVEKKQVLAGSTTCCVLTLDETNGLLKSANIGDSGFLVMRRKQQTDGTPSKGPYELLYRSMPQQHYHNAPYQLAIIPEYLRGRFDDSPKDAVCHSLKLCNGDLIIVGTDGLFDNLYDHQIVEFVNQNLDKSEFELAKNLLLKARQIAFGYENVKSTPFQDQSEKNGFFYLGGKPDDITVVVARVVMK